MNDRVPLPYEAVVAAALADPAIRDALAKLAAFQASELRAAFGPRKHEPLPAVRGDEAI